MLPSSDIGSLLVSQIFWTVDTCSLQIANQLSYQINVCQLKLVVVSEPMGVGLQNDQTTRSIQKNSSLLETLHALPDRLKRQPKGAGERCARDAELYSIRLNGAYTAEPFVEIGISHDVNDVRIENGMDDQQIQRIEVTVVTNSLSERSI